MRYVPVQWSPGESLDVNKLKQMVENDEVIRGLYSSGPQGILKRMAYFGPDVTNNVGAYRSFMESKVFIPKWRWIKLSLTISFHKMDAGNTRGVFRVMRDGSEVAFASLPPSNMGGQNETMSWHVQRILNPATEDKVSTFSVDIYGHTNVQRLTLGQMYTPTFLTIEDIGGRAI